ncbi:MAG TPA: metalloregulator ArsR/SmtB family transcription factor [Micropepsaceae bacterium]|jgi:DNA-binding transcriptional ArsR family regulator|nr:metalloregulator ArsR/SmtB family transcription factor [Micropepsaceae bacterium]
MNISAQLDLSFAALADPTRRAILRRLAQGETTVAELAKPFPISAPAISRHLRVLEAAALIRQEREGKFRRCRIEPAGLQTAVQWLDFYRGFWSESFDRLDQYLKTTRPGLSKRKARSYGKGKIAGR